MSLPTNMLFPHKKDQNIDTRSEVMKQDWMAFNHLLHIGIDNED